MDHEHSSHALNAIRTLKASQNQDANAIAIDSMLIHLKMLFKKYLNMKKILKQLTQHETEMNEEDVNIKMTSLNEETKNLTLALDKSIPPDKRMTNLLYMRIIKDISHFEKIIPFFTEVIPAIEKLYAQQVRTESFSILALYLACEKRFIQQIKMTRLKVFHILEEKKMKFIVEKIHFEQTIFDKKNDFFLQKDQDFQCFTQKRFTLSDFNKDIIEAVLDNFVEKKIQQKKIVSSIKQVAQKGSSSIVLSDYKQRVNPIFQSIYSPLDLAGVEIVSLFIPTLRPQDNIQLIYRKVSLRNKKQRKQRKQFQAGFSLYLFRKQEFMKRKLRKSQIYLKKVDNSIMHWSKNVQNTKKQGQKILSNSKDLLTKKYSIRTIDLLKPIKENQKQGSVSRFRQRLQQSLQNSKSVSTTISHFRPNNLVPIASANNKRSLQIKLKRKRTSQLSSKENDDDNSAKIIKKQKQSKSKKFQIKPVKNTQKRGRSLKIDPNKQSANKKLRL